MSWQKERLQRKRRSIRIERIINFGGRRGGSYPEVRAAVAVYFKRCGRAECEDMQAQMLAGGGR